MAQARHIPARLNSARGNRNQVFLSTGAGLGYNFSLKTFCSPPPSKNNLLLLTLLPRYLHISGGTYHHALYLLHSRTIGILAGFLSLIGQVERSKVSREIYIHTFIDGWGKKESQKKQ